MNLLPLIPHNPFGFIRLCNFFNDCIFGYSIRFFFSCEFKLLLVFSLCLQIFPPNVWLCLNRVLFYYPEFSIPIPIFIFFIFVHSNTIKMRLMRIVCRLWYVRVQWPLFCHCLTQTILRNMKPVVLCVRYPSFMISVFKYVYSIDRFKWFVSKIVEKWRRYSSRAKY